MIFQYSKYHCNIDTMKLSRGSQVSTMQNVNNKPTVGTWYQKQQIKSIIHNLVPESKKSHQQPNMGSKVKF